MPYRAALAACWALTAPGCPPRLCVAAPLAAPSHPHGHTAPQIVTAAPPAASGALHLDSAHARPRIAEPLSLCIGSRTQVRALAHACRSLMRRRRCPGCTDTA